MVTGMREERGERRGDYQVVRIVGGKERQEAHPWLAHLLLTSTDPSGKIRMSECMGSLINRSDNLFCIVRSMERFAGCSC